MRENDDKRRAIIREYLTSLDYEAGGGIRVAFVTFGSGASVKLNLYDADSVPRVLRSLDQVNYQGGETDMKKAFQIARRLVLVHSRQRARKVMFLLTDGLYTGKSPVNIAKALRQEGVEMYALTFSEHYDADNLQEIVDDQSRIKVVTSVDDLPTVY
ncbi:sushi, von Willebrand factor type A, EGF and pentraxin domain-containing protein 1-like [Asterias rubens]|uniref:sushi, von Willebrand factor type A, EGF and pentraxin domain-containing protein 1-like n=1 Tax=Asterias rubens TaxID=7604 RepID=UPI001455D43E|nr:sushi, von Willebrand factor type A, EGF and pentraxin domain-containing protein 1-like [Asterias rubens]